MVIYMLFSRWVADMPTTAKVQQCLYYPTQHNDHYKLTSQLYTGPSLAVMSILTLSECPCLPLHWVGGRELALRRQQTKTACAKCACRQARHAPGPRLPSMRILFPASFMLQPVGNSYSLILTSGLFFSNQFISFKPVDLLSEEGFHISIYIYKHNYIWDTRGGFKGSPSSQTSALH